MPQPRDMAGNVWRTDTSASSTIHSTVAASTSPANLTNTWTAVNDSAGPHKARATGASTTISRLRARLRRLGLSGRRPPVQQQQQQQQQLSSSPTTTPSRISISAPASSAAPPKPAESAPQSSTFHTAQPHRPPSPQLPEEAPSPPAPPVDSGISATAPTPPTPPGTIPPPPASPASQPPTMAAERTLQQITGQLKANPAMPYAEASGLLSKAKLALLQAGALTPAATTPPRLLPLARAVYEQGALASIRARIPDAFTRYVAQLQPFYELPADQLTPDPETRNKVTGLYLLLLLTQGRYAEFHSELESLGTREGVDGPDRIESDKFLGYPVKLERWLMEGSYDRVWKAMKKGEVPSEEYGAFSEILTSQIRSEIASSSERAYPFLPLSSTKSLLFLDSEGAVVDFARQRGWTIRDGTIFFPTAAEAGEDDEKELSQMVIENTLGYARELETIV